MAADYTSQKFKDALSKNPEFSAAVKQAKFGQFLGEVQAIDQGLLGNLIQTSGESGVAPTASEMQQAISDITTGAVGPTYEQGAAYTAAADKGAAEIKSLMEKYDVTPNDLKMVTEGGNNDLFMNLGQSATQNPEGIYTAPLDVSSVSNPQGGIGDFSLSEQVPDQDFMDTTLPAILSVVSMVGGAAGLSPYMKAGLDAASAGARSDWDTSQMINAGATSLGSSVASDFVVEAVNPGQGDLGKFVPWEDGVETLGADGVWTGMEATNWLNNAAASTGDAVFGANGLLSPISSLPGAGAVAEGMASVYDRVANTLPAAGEAASVVGVGQDFLDTFANLGYDSAPKNLLEDLSKVTLNEEVDQQKILDAMAKKGLFGDGSAQSGSGNTSSTSSGNGNVQGEQEESIGIWGQQGIQLPQTNPPPPFTEEEEKNRVGPFQLPPTTDTTTPTGTSGSGSTGTSVVVQHDEEDPFIPVIIPEPPGGSTGGFTGGDFEIPLPPGNAPPPLVPEETPWGQDSSIRVAFGDADTRRGTLPEIEADINRFLLHQKGQTIQNQFGTPGTPIQTVGANAPPPLQLPQGQRGITLQSMLEKARQQGLIG